ncbi:MAG: GumC family protein [Geminicoccaceae bacterium]
MTSLGTGDTSSVEGREFAWMWLAVRKHLGKILLLVLIASTAAAAFVLTRTKQYTAYAEILLGPHTNDFGNLDEDNGRRPEGISPADMESEVRLISSSDVVRHVIKDLDLSLDEPAWDLKSYILSWANAAASRSEAPLSEAAVEAKKIKEFRNKLSIERDPLAYVITVGFETSDPEQSALIANALADAYLTDRIDAKRRSLSVTAENLRRSVEEMGAWIRTAEREIDDFRAESDLYAVGGASPAEQRYDTLSQQLTEARLELTNARARLSQADEAARNGKALDSLREVQTSQVISSLRAEESEIKREIADLGSRFGANHPVMTNKNAELLDVQQSIEREIDRIIGQLQLETAVAENRFNTLKAQVEAAQADLASSQTTRIRLNELERGAEAPRRVYETMLERYQRAREQEKILADSARIIGRAAVPDQPSNVSGLLLLGFTAAGTCAAGIGLAFLLEARRLGFANAREVERALGHPVVSMVPLVRRSNRAKTTKNRWQVFEAYGLTEAIRSLVYAVLPKSDMHERETGKIVAITSSYPDEGKSTISLSLARQAGFSGLRTLLIEGDLRKPGLKDGLKTIKPTYGLVHLLRSTVNDAYECISTEPDSGVDIMLGFGPADDAFTLLRGDRMALLLDGVRSRYDLVIIDCAPIMAVSETRSLIELADESVFVVRWKSTERSAAKTAISDLERMGAKIAGIVLNQVDLREHLKYEEADRLAYQEKYQGYITT